MKTLLSLFLAIVVLSTVVSGQTQVIRPSHPLVVNNGTGDGSYPFGHIQEITAPQTLNGSNFVMWITIQGARTIANPRSATTTVKMMGHPMRVAAIYANAKVWYPDAYEPPDNQTKPSAGLFLPKKPEPEVTERREMKLKAKIERGELETGHENRIFEYLCFGISWIPRQEGLWHSDHVGFYDSKRGGNKLNRGQHLSLTRTNIPYSTEGSDPKFRILSVWYEPKWLTSDMTPRTTLEQPREAPKMNVSTPLDLVLGNAQSGYSYTTVKSVSSSLLPVEVEKLSPMLRDESDAEITGSEKPAVAPKSTEMVERDPSATPTPLNDASAIRIAWRDMKVKIGTSMTGKKVTWSMTPQFTPLQSNGTLEAAPRFRGKWGTAANSVYRHRFSASEKYGGNGYESVAQMLEQDTNVGVTTIAKTTVDAAGYTAIRVNLPSIGFNKARIKIVIEDTEGEFDLIDFEVPAVIVIDPGHGTGGVTGGSADGSVGLHSLVTEGDSALDIGTRTLKEIKRIGDKRNLAIKKYSTKLKANPRGNVGLQEREQKGREFGADVFVSLHFDGATNDLNSKECLYRNPFGMIDQDNTLWNRNPRADWALALRVRRAVQSAIASVEPASSINASETAYDNWDAAHNPDAERVTSETNEARLQKGLGMMNDGTAPGNQNGNHIAGGVRYVPLRSTLIEMERTANKQADELFNGNTSYSAATGEIALTTTAESMRAKVATNIAEACIDDVLILDLAAKSAIPLRDIGQLDFEDN